MKQQTVFLSLLLSGFLLVGCSKSKTIVGPDNSGKWTQVTGLPTFRHIISNGAEFLAAGDGGLFRSTDDGMTWTRPDSILVDGLYDVTAINGGILVSDNFNGGLYFSSDNGATWAARDSGLGTNYFYLYQTVFGFTVSGSTIFAASTASQVFKSTDNGVSWTAADNGIYSAVTTFTVASNGSHIFAGTEGAYVSTNAGESWTAANSGLAWGIYSQSEPPLVVSFACEGTKVFAGTLGAKIFVSTNYGTSWSDVTDTLPSYPESWIYLAANDSAIFAGYDAGVFTSTNGGSSWNNITDNLPSPVVVSLALVGKDLFAETLDGTVWRLSL